MPKIENTKYERWYLNLIEVARKERPLEPHIPNTEKHHILPRCLGGTDGENNLVRFSIRQHYIAHMLLIRMYEGREKYQLEWALFRLSGKPSNRIILTSRQFEKSRLTLHSSLKGRKQSPEHIAKRVAQTTGEGNGMHKKNGRTPTQLGKSHKEETKEKIRLAQLERFANPDYINPNIGRTMPDEIKKAISETKKSQHLTMSEGNKKKMSDRVKGENHPQWGKKRPNDVKEKISKKMSKMWIVTSPDGTVQKFKGAKEVATALNIGQWDVYNYSKSINTINGYTIRKSIS